MDYLCLDLVNSSWYITHKLFTDPLKDSKWVRILADKWNIKGLVPPTFDELQLIIKQRSEITELFAKLVNNVHLDIEDFDLIDSYMKNIDYKKKLLKNNGQFQLITVPEILSWDWFLAEVAASFASLCSIDYFNHLKICENTECGWYFIDESKLHNRKWCDDTCSTLMKVRRFRQKQKS